MNIKSRILGSLLALAVSTPARATLIGVQLDLSGSTNVPTFELTNTSTSAEIETFIFTIGDTSRNFDGVENITETNLPLSFNSVLNSPDDNLAGAVRSNQLNFDFADFNPGGSFGFDADVDIDSANTVEDYRSVFFNNGGEPNSVASVVFSNGMTLDFTLGDQPAPLANAFTFTASRTIGVPVPGTLALFATGLLVAAGLTRRRWSA